MGVVEPCLVRGPDMVELANGTHHFRAKIGKLLKCCSNHFDAGRECATRGGAPDHHDAHVRHCKRVRWLRERAARRHFQYGSQERGTAPSLTSPRILHASELAVRKTFA